MKDHRELRVREKGVMPDINNPLAIPPLPAGYVGRWIRVMIHGQEDTKNINKRIQLQGWEPVKADEVPEAWRYMVCEGGRWDGVLQFQDLILAKLPEKEVELIRDAVIDRAARQEQGIRARLQSNSSDVMPFIEDEDFGQERPRKGRKVRL